MQTLTSELIADTWLQMAARDLTSNRRLRRVPFFRPITIATRSRNNQCLTGFSRDISPTGIGLLHRRQLDESCTSIEIPTAVGGRASICVEIKWCEPCGQGWYLSGAKFLGLRTRQSLKLLLTTAIKDADRRFKHRYPFFHPVTVETENRTLKMFALTRDVSPGGIGLLHSAPLKRDAMSLHVLGEDDQAVEMSVDITWCRQCADGWFLSGGRFRRLQIEELPILHF